MSFLGLGFRIGPRGLSVAGLIALCAIVGTLGFVFVQVATSRLLDAEARIDAARWSAYLSANVRQLKNIAGGATANRDDRAKLDRVLGGGYLMSYRIYDSSGHLRLKSASSPVDSTVGKPLAEIDPALSSAFNARKASTLLLKGNAPGQPGYYALSLVPIKLGDQTIGWLSVTIDQTERAELFYSIATNTSISVGILLILAPIFGFWYHARNKARLSETIDTLSMHDQLTGLAVKSKLLDALVDKLAKTPPDAPPSALLLVDLAGAPAIGRSHGQQTEERLIREAADILKSIVPQMAQIASAGRGLFLVLIEELADPMTALNLARDITHNLTAGAQIDGVKLACPCYCGIALTSSDGKTANELMRSAELALVSAREQGTPGYGFFNPELAGNAERRISIQRAVTQAAEQKSFRLDFQPVYTIRTGELSGFEALIRLHDSELGPISPAEFIPIAEQAGLINEIGAWAIDEACRVAAQWPQHLMVAVNLSPSQFNSGTLIGDVRRALEKNGFPAYRLEVEITEGTLMNDSELVLGQLRVLRDMGVAVALDDFGTGYSSLSYLWKFPFSKIKIDRSFVNALDESASAKGILRSIVKLGHSLGLTVTAEGIETPKQLTTLRDLGCDLAQGFLLDRPARVADLAAIILRNFANGLNRRSRDGAGKKKVAA